MTIEEVYFGAGCFWGSEEYFTRIAGVKLTEVGYANGETTSHAPTYEQVCRGRKGFCEVVKVTFDTKVVTLQDLLESYFQIINPYIKNKQGNDKGVQYRTLISSKNIRLLDDANKFINIKQENDLKKIVVQVEPLHNYFKAEEYHQRYLKKNPNGYCHIKLD